jgi:hypothetical protein
MSEISVFAGSGVIGDMAASRFAVSGFGAALVFDAIAAAFDGVAGEAFARLAF